MEVHLFDYTELSEPRLNFSSILSAAGTPIRFIGVRSMFQVIEPRTMPPHISPYTLPHFRSYFVYRGRKSTLIYMPTLHPLYPRCSFQICLPLCYKASKALFRICIYQLVSGIEDRVHLPATVLLLPMLP